MNALKRLSVAAALFAMAAGAAAQTTIAAGESAALSLPLWHTLTMTGSGATCIQTRLSDTPGNGQSQGTHSVSSSDTVVVGPYATVTRHEIRCSVGSLSYVLAPASFVVTGGIIASDIDASDVPADEECLTYEGTGPALEWQTCGGGLADGDYGDVTVSGTGAVITIDANAVALGTDTTGNYAGSASEGGEANTLAPAVVIEGTTADDYEGNFAFTDMTADWTWTWGASGNLTAGTAGTGTAPAFKLPGGTAGMWDDWGTGGVAVTFANSTAFSLLMGTTYKMILDTDELTVPTSHKIGWGTIGGSQDVGFIRSSAGVVKVTDGGAGTGDLIADRATLSTGSDGGALIGSTLLRDTGGGLVATDYPITVYRTITGSTLTATGDVYAGGIVGAPAVALTPGAVGSCGAGQKGHLRAAADGTLCSCNGSVWTATPGSGSCT